MRAGIIGLGNLGTAVGNLIAVNGHEVIGWEYNPSVADEVNRQHTNQCYLPGVELHPSLTATTGLAAAFEGSDAVFIALPSIFIERTLRPLQGKVAASTVLVNMAKGIDGATGLTSFQTLSTLFPDNRRVMLSGPSVANEFARQLPTVVVIAGQSTADLMRVAQPARQ